MTSLLTQNLNNQFLVDVKKDVVDYEPVFLQ